MTINLSEETIKTVCNALRHDKTRLQDMLRRVEIGRANKEKKEVFKSQLAEVENALQVFEDSIK